MATRDRQPIGSHVDNTYDPDVVMPPMALHLLTTCRAANPTTARDSPTTHDTWTPTLLAGTVVVIHGGDLQVAQRVNRATVTRSIPGLRPQAPVWNRIGRHDQQPGRTPLLFVDNERGPF